MSRSVSPVISDEENALELEKFIADLMLDPDRESVASELRGAGPTRDYRSIYGDSAIRLWRSNDSRKHHIDNGTTSGTVRYQAYINLPEPHESVPIRILVSLLPSYPATSPPQLQLLSRYIGAYGVDSALFGSILRTFISVNGVEWSEDIVCVFDGLQSVIERCIAWYEDRLSAEKAEELVHEDAKETAEPATVIPPLDIHNDQIRVPSSSVSMPDGIEIVEAEALTDRKSVFIGRACRITDPSQVFTHPAANSAVHYNSAKVPTILAYLMADRHISRAAHPIINAWRCQVGNLLHQDNDDDGETAAGGRLAHLLQILEVNNVLVVVTRYFGGIHLGPDRFKHINQAARNALELGGFLEVPDIKKNTGRGKRR